MFNRKPRRSEFRSGPKSGLLQRVAIAWYEADAYLSLFEMIGDAMVVPFNRETWLGHALDRERYFKRSGSMVVRVPVHGDRFAAWCAAKGVQPDKGALGSFVSAHATGTQFWRVML